MPAHAPTRPYGFGLVTNLCIVLLILFAFVSLISLVAGLRELEATMRVPDGAHVGAGELTGTRSTLSLLQGMALVVCATAIVAWAWLAKAGVLALGADGMSFSPFLAAACFIVPVASLWLPYRAMAETWRASRDPGRWRAQVVPPLLAAWWASWLCFVATAAAARFAREAGAGAALTDTAALANDVCGAVSAVLLVLVVNAVANAQDAWHEALRARSRRAAVPSLASRQGALTR